MAYPYNNLYPYSGMGQRPYQPQMTYQPVQQIQSVGMVWIDGRNEGNMFPVAPNEAVLLRDKSDPSVLYLKWADATGKPSMTVYDERKEQPAAPQNQTQSIDYATKAELDNVLTEMNSLKQRIDELASKPVKQPKTQKEDKE